MENKVDDEFTIKEYDKSKKYNKELYESIFRASILYKNYLFYKIYNYIFYRKIDKESKTYMFKAHTTEINDLLILELNNNNYIKLIISYGNLFGKEKCGLKLFEISDNKIKNILNINTFDNDGVSPDYLIKINNFKIIYINDFWFIFTVFNINTKQKEAIINPYINDFNELELRYFFKKDCPNFYDLENINREKIFEKLKNFNLISDIFMKSKIYKIKEKYIYHIDGLFYGSEEMRKDTHFIDVYYFDGHNKYNSKIYFKKIIKGYGFKVDAFCKNFINNMIYFVFSVESNQGNINEYYLGKIKNEENAGVLKHIYLCKDYTYDYDNFPNEIKYMNNKIYIIESNKNDIIRNIIELDETKFSDNLIL